MSNYVIIRLFISGRVIDVRWDPSDYSMPSTPDRDPLMRFKDRLQDPAVKQFNLTTGGQIFIRGTSIDAYRVIL